MADDKAFLEYIVKSLVDYPNDVKIDRTVDEMGVLITMTVNGADMGKIIGRQGNTAKAIRTLLRVIGMKNNARVNLKINEPEVGVQERPMHDSANESVSAPHAQSYGSDMPAPSSHMSSSSAASRSVEDALEDLKGI
ncbi:MAG: KH domain-containing protein [bacterium]